MLLRRRVHVAPGRPAAARDAARFGIHGYAVHVAEMDHHAALADRVAGVVVAATPDCDLEAGGAREAHRFHDFISARAPDDDRRPAVDGPVPQRA